jgi:hypothetical protein
LARNIFRLGPFFYDAWNQLSRFGKIGYGDLQVFEGVRLGFELQIWHALQANTRLNVKLLTTVEVHHLARFAGSMATTPIRTHFAYRFSQLLDLWKADGTDLARANRAVEFVDETERTAGSIVRHIANIHRDLLFLERGRDAHRKESHHGDSKHRRVANAEDKSLDPGVGDAAAGE